MLCDVEDIIVRSANVFVGRLHPLLQVAYTSAGMNAATEYQLDPAAVAQYVRQRNSRCPFQDTAQQCAQRVECTWVGFT
jgi:hypothetical protein